jgi:hypothetical protein
LILTRLLLIPILQKRKLVHVTGFGDIRIRSRPASFGAATGPPGISPVDGFIDGLVRIARVVRDLGESGAASEDAGKERHENEEETE